MCFSREMSNLQTSILILMRRTPLLPLTALFVSFWHMRHYVNHLVKGGNVSIAYLYGRININVYIEQLTEHSEKLEDLGFVCKLQRSIYGIRQAGCILSFMLVETLTVWNSVPSFSDERVFF